MGEQCFWCQTDPDEDAKRFRATRAGVHYSHAVARQPPMWIMESNSGTPDPRESFKGGGSARDGQ